MSRVYLIIVCLFASVILQAEEGFVDLFNGKDLTGWENPYNWGDSVIKDGEIHLTTTKSKFFLATVEKYKDFIFEGEIFLPAGKSNSGFMFRCHKDKNKIFGYQAECDPTERAWSGGLYDEGRRKWMNPDKDTKVDEATAYKKNFSPEWTDEKKKAFKAGDWNKYRIECKGNEIKITLNGVLTTHVIDTTDAEGYIAIQHHGEKGQTYRFRNLRIKELKD